MPLPTPHKGESQKDFVDRCMSNDTMKSDYPDNKQRLAVCFKQEKQRETPSEDVEPRAPFRLERRPYGWERRAVVAGTKSHPLIRGTAIVFNERSQDLGGFVEVIRPEAFQRTQDEHIDLRAFFDHDPAKVLGRQSAGTLKVNASRLGVTVEIDPPSPTDPPNLMQSIERGDITGMSFSFRTMPQGDDWKRDGGQIVRYVTDMRVYEVSVVSMPAYEQTDVGVALRGLQHFLGRAPVPVAELQKRAAVRAAGWR